MDIDKAIEFQSQAVALTHSDDVARAKWLSNLGNSYNKRFQRLEELADIDRAIECQTQAEVLLHEGHPLKHGLLFNPGGAYGARFNYRGEQKT